MLDLYNKQYSRATLKKYIYGVKLIDIVKTQKLDSSFIVRYILNPNYQLNEVDEFLNIDLIMIYQKHIDREKLVNELAEYSPDDDSIEDFESVSKKN